MTDENYLVICTDQRKFAACVVDSGYVGHLRYLHGVDFRLGGF